MPGISFGQTQHNEVKQIPKQQGNHMSSKENYGAYIEHSAQFSEKAQEAMREVIERATTDMGYRAWLLEDPRAAVEDVVGENTINPDLHIQFVENDGAAATFVLPDPVDELATLSDEELEAVAGGSCIMFSFNSQGCTSNGCTNPEEEAA